jgi:DNA polymerase-3 subunit alpha
VHLHVHSSYSLLEGALTIGKLAELAKADRQPALALTDTDNMFGALEFSNKLGSSGIQPIHRLRALRRFRRSGGAAPSRPGAETAAARAACRARRGLPQSHGADVAGLSSTWPPTSRRTSSWMRLKRRRTA